MLLRVQGISESVARRFNPYNLTIVHKLHSPLRSNLVNVKDPAKLCMRYLPYSFSDVKKIPLHAVVFLWELLHINPRPKFPSKNSESMTVYINVYSHLTNTH